jgi:hypothetical protein
VKTLTVRLPDDLAARIEAESRERQVTKSDVVRERLEAGEGYGARPALADVLSDVIGAVDGLPEDLSARRQHYLSATGYGKRRR